MPNNDYILRGDAISETCRGCQMTEYCRTTGESCEDVKRIKAIPAADVEPKRKTGYWISGDHFECDEHGEMVRHPGGITCSRCRVVFAARYLWSRYYCPHCGLQMLPKPPKGEEDDEK